MRVGVGVILSVLSSSALAAVIPNYDSRGILLVRRTESPENKDLLWKRADEEQEGSEPSSSGAGASTETGASAGTSTSGKSVSSRLGRPFRAIKTRWGHYKAEDHAEA
ncbi:hypothetical protein BASA62_009125 [Batrachochytrium salamandrivorans]|nr:hypothetical protein BASA62_009125 [Batrachochytrium salamandrivorans]